jgi:hypothetical protein
VITSSFLLALLPSLTKENLFYRDATRARQVANAATTSLLTTESTPIANIVLQKVMFLQKNQLKRRSLSVLIAIPVVVTAIHWNVWSYFFLFLFVVALAMLEFYTLVSLGGIRPNRWGGIIVGIMTYVLTFSVYQRGHAWQLYLPTGPYGGAYLSYRTL